MTHLISRASFVFARIVVSCIGVACVTGARAADSFEVAAIRENRSAGMNTQIQLPPGGRLVVTNASLKTLIRNAYGLLGFQLAGGPNWLDETKFDINAKTGGPEAITTETLKPLLQDLLQDRFHLRTHWETREGPVYALLIDNKGQKLHPPNSDGGGKTSRGMNTSKGTGKARMRGTDVPVTLLASNLANQLGRYVIDMTGLTGNYDFLLDWDPDQAGSTTDVVGPSLFTAVKEQLGLRLEPRRGPMQVLVIDGAEKPSEN